MISISHPRWNPSLTLNNGLGAIYTSKSQKSRVLTELWVEENMYCPVCGNCSVSKYPANTPVADFFCPSCKADFELKSKDVKSPRQPRVIVDGSWNTMLARLRSASNPHLLFMLRQDAHIQNFIFISNFFFSPSVIAQRTPLSSKARRAGWRGCNILYGAIPAIGKIPLIAEGIPVPRHVVDEAYKRSCALSMDRLAARGWLLDVMKCVENIKKDNFSLKDMYAFIPYFRERHPQNAHIEEKIRQQLQMLRDRGLIQFVSRGTYCKSPTH